MAPEEALKHIEVLVKDADSTLPPTAIDGLFEMLRGLARKGLDGARLQAADMPERTGGSDREEPGRRP